MNKLFTLIILSCFSSLVFAACPSTMVIDQQQLGSNFDNWILSYMFGTGSIVRSQEIFKQDFVPAVSGELPKIELYGKLGNTYNTNPSLAFSCFASGSDDFPLGTSSYQKIAQQFYINSTYSAYQWGTIRWKMLKAGGLVNYGDVLISIQADDGSGAPDGTPIVEGTIVEGTAGDGAWNYYPTNNTYMVFWQDGSSNPEVANLSTGGTYWIVWEVDNITAPGSYWLRGDLGTACQSNASLRVSYYDGSWHPLANRQIEFEMNPASAFIASNNLCISVYDGASFLKSELVWFNTTSNAWSSTSSLGWRTNNLCNLGSSADGPTLTSGHIYTLSVRNPYYGDNFISMNYSAGAYAFGNASFQYWGNPTPLVDPYGVALKFRTYTCGPAPSATPTPSPAPSVTPTPTLPPGSCTSAADCSYGYNCNRDTGICYQRSQDYTAWGNYWIELFFNWNTAYLVIAGTIILIFIVALPFMSKLRDE